jgi:hypothetical protein
MACDDCLKDGPMTSAQMFNYIRLNHVDLKAYFLKDRDLVVIPASDDNAGKLDLIREIALRKGLNCAIVNAAWPEFFGTGLIFSEEHTDFFVISEIKGKYMQVF